MDKESKDLIQLNIKKRVDADFTKFKKELVDLLSNYLPHSSHTSFGYPGEKYITGNASGIVKKFTEEIEPILRTNCTEKREKEFSDILTNLGSYLEMMNR